MMPIMRTMVTLDTDTEHLRSAMRERNASRAERPFTTTAKPMRLRAGIDPTRLHDLDAALEVERFKALTARPEREQTRR